MSRLNDLMKDESFLFILETQMNAYANEKNRKTFHYFAHVLNLNTPSAYSQLKNVFKPYENKFLKVDELFIIIDNLENHKKPILDYICKKYDFVCSNKATSDNNDVENVKDILIQITGTNGNLFNKFIEFNSDNNLDNEEIQNLLNSSYEARQKLIELENNLKAKLK